MVIVLTYSAECHFVSFVGSYLLYVWKWNDGLRTGLRGAMEANYVTELVPGASGQNTARVVQWLFGVPRCTTVLACIGKDSTGRELAR